MGLVIPYPVEKRGPASASRGADLLARLEAENAALRHRAVQIALEIQELGESI